MRTEYHKGLERRGTGWALHCTDIADGVDRKLFDNDARFNRCVIMLDQPIDYLLSESGDEDFDEYRESELVLASVTQFGVVISTDQVGSFSGSGLHGFHNFLIPWARIQSIYQYITT